jgi:hypothetical protein
MDDPTGNETEQQCATGPAIKQRPAGSTIGWTIYPPLTALALISIGPSVLAVLIYLLHLTFGLNSLTSFIVVRIERPDLQNLVNLFVSPLVVALFNWPFVVLYLVTLSKAKKEAPLLTSVRLAMWVSLGAMAVPNIPAFVTAIDENLSPPPFGEGTGIFLGLFVLFPVPILGLIGWASGRFIAWLVRPKPPGYLSRP